MKKTTIIALAAIVLAVTNIVLAVSVYQLYYPMQATVQQTPKVTVYEDAGLTAQLTDGTLIDWGNVATSNTKYLWIKNTGNCLVSLNLTIQNLPIDWSLTWDSEAYNLAIAQVIKATLTLTRPGNETAATYNWDSYVKANIV